MHGLQTTLDQFGWTENQRGEDGRHRPSTRLLHITNKEGMGEKGRERERDIGRERERERGRERERERGRERERERERKGEREKGRYRERERGREREKKTTVQLSAALESFASLPP